MVPPRHSTMTRVVPAVPLTGSGRQMPVLGLGTASFPLPAKEDFMAAVLESIALGYRHFDTASFYLSERLLGEAIAEALRQGLIQSRDELFITTKVWCTELFRDRVLPSLESSLQNLQLDYLDLLLIHWPVSVTSKEVKWPVSVDEWHHFDHKAVWEAMEECCSLGLTKSIGVSNFSCKRLGEILSIAKIPPAVNQVEMHPLLHQKKLRAFCKEKGIVITAYSPLGGHGTLWGGNAVMECDVLKEIATARGKTLAQVCLRWVIEQGVTVVVKSFKPQRLKENIDIFDWVLTKEDLDKINQLPQTRMLTGDFFVSDDGPIKSLDDLWDDQI